MNSRPAKLFIIITVCAAVAYGRPAGAETLKKEPDANELSCGQKGLVENNTCPADQILQITGHRGLMAGTYAEPRSASRARDRL
jgi:hypothetical protein